MRKTSHPPEFYLRTTQHLANRYAGYAIPPLYGLGYTHNKDLSVDKFAYHDKKNVDIKLCEYTNLEGGDCGPLSLSCRLYLLGKKERHKILRQDNMHLN